VIYPLLRGIAGVALRWYYAAIDVEGVERIPRDGPVLLVVNHPNALVDALVAGWVVPRPLVLTAKATLFQNPLLAAFLSWVGVVPLRRAKDESAIAVDPSRNDDAFRAVHDALAGGRAALIFPEGISHDEPRLAPIRTGAARIALQGLARPELRELRIVPIGITFERKEQPRSRVYVQVGEPLALRSWRVRDAWRAVEELTFEIEARMRAVTLNFASSDAAARARALASSFARLTAGAAPTNAPTALATEVAMTRRIARARSALECADEATVARADALVHGLGAFERMVASYGVALEDIEISRAVAPGARFTIREGLRALVMGPVALWGTLNHWLPFNAARAIGMLSVQSAADPAMRTIVAGAALVLAFYLAQGALVAHLAGLLVAAAYLVSLPVAADVSFWLRARLARARRRARAYLLFRRRPALQERWRTELDRLRVEASAVEQQLMRAADAGVTAAR
jgi:glycerol-3-phosphate O-acyltransferase/dihydroxyacetone phosphate acyltransferase